jgi:dimeric dUTPase (all-alpha-NTP-PPase superfamily)
MSINVKKQLVVNMDMLTKMMEMQEKLNTNVIEKKQMQHYNPDSMNVHYKSGYSATLTEELNRRNWVDRLASALQAEVCETREAATQNVKWWKDKTKDMDGLKEEIIDCFHFLMSMALASGMNADEVFTRYVEKNKQNFERKDWDVNKETK